MNTADMLKCGLLYRKSEFDPSHTVIEVGKGDDRGAHCVRCFQASNLDQPCTAHNYLVHTPLGVISTRVCLRCGASSLYDNLPCTGVPDGWKAQTAKHRMRWRTSSGAYQTQHLECERCGAGSQHLDQPCTGVPGGWAKPAGKTTKVFSFDVESDGLRGRAFAVGAVVRVNGVETARFFGYLGSRAVHRPWVVENVLPAMTGCWPTHETYEAMCKDFVAFYREPTHETYEAMCKDFVAFYREHSCNAKVVAHMAIPVEAGFFQELYLHRVIGEYEGPCPLIDVAATLDAKGFDPISVDAYLKSRRLVVPGGMSTHNPLYDAVAAAMAYEDLLRTP